MVTSLHQESAKRRDQILASLEQEARENIKDAQLGGAKQEKRIADLQRALAADAMPGRARYGRQQRRGAGGGL